MKNISRWLKLVLELGKYRIAMLVTLSTATGFILAAGEISFGIIPPVAGIFLLALGSGALNQAQERKKDALMVRTKSRPIPSGRITVQDALIVSSMLMFAGTGILMIFTTPAAVLLGVLTAVWYNGIYTYLKRITPLAVIPGSLIGSLPPLVGWASAGYSIISTRPLVLALFFFIWQIPHFWLLLLNFGGDYQKAGYPSLTELLNKNQLGRVTFVWIVATAAIIIFMPMFGLGKSVYIFILLFLAAMILVWESRKLLYPRHADFSFQLAFRGINIFILSVMFLLSLDSLIQL